MSKCACPLTVPDSFSDTCSVSWGAITALGFLLPDADETTLFNSTSILTQAAWDAAKVALAPNKLYIGPDSSSVEVTPSDANIFVAANGVERRAQAARTQINFQFYDLPSDEEVKLKNFLNCVKGIKFVLIDEFGQVISKDDGAGEPLFFEAETVFLGDRDNKGVTAPDLHNGTIRVKEGELADFLIWDTSALSIAV